MLSIKNRIIAVCCAAIDSDPIKYYMNYFTEYAKKNNYKILFFRSFSDLYRAASQGKHDIGESCIFSLINYKLIDAMIILPETIKCPAVRDDLIRHAKLNNIPVISIDHYIEGCYNINFDYKTALEKILCHLIEDHHYTCINFIAGIKGNAYSDERIDIYKKVLKEHNIPIEEERIGYGGFWSIPTKKVIKDFINSELPMPQAIACANDTMAITAYNSLINAGYDLPQEIAITGVKTQNLAIPLSRRNRINSAFVPLHIAKIYILKLCLDEEIIPRCRFPCSRGYFRKCINWQKKQ